MSVSTGQIPIQCGDCMLHCESSRKLNFFFFKITVLYDVAPWHLVNCNQHFQRMCCLSIQNRRLFYLKMETASFSKLLVAIYRTVSGRLLQTSDNLPSSSALKAEAAYPTETWIIIYQTTRCHVPEGSRLHSRSGNLKFHSPLS